MALATPFNAPNQLRHANESHAVDPLNPVSMPRASSLILLNADAEICLIRRDDDASILFPSCWGMIGGAAESDEQPEATIVRECCEETGIQIVSPKFFVRFLTFWHEESVFIHQLTQTNPVIRLGEGVEYYFFRPEAILGLKTAFYTAPICALYKLAFPETLAP